MFEAAMKLIGEIDGQPVYWAEPGRFTTPGIYYWNGAENVHVPLTRPLPHGDRGGDWVMVPREPTREMLDRGTAAISYDGTPPPDAAPDHDYDDDLRRSYAAMLSAAPDAPVGEVAAESMALLTANAAADEAEATLAKIARVLTDLDEPEDYDPTLIQRAEDIMLAYRNNMAILQRRGRLCAAGRAALEFYDGLADQHRPGEAAILDALQAALASPAPETEGVGWQDRASELAGLLEAALPYVDDEGLHDRIVMLLTAPDPCGEVEAPGERKS